MNYFTMEWLRVDLPALAAQGMQCSAKLALEAIEDEQAKVSTLVEALEAAAEHLQACVPTDGWGLRNAHEDNERADILAKVRAALAKAAPSQDYESWG